MTEHRPDDDRLSGAMRAALEQSRAAGDCPDASLIAAYFERTLGATERSACHSHVSTCARCQMVLAALVRSDDRPEPRSVWAWLSLAGWRWAVPAAAAATAFGLWIMVDQPAPGPVADILEETRPRAEVESSLPERSARSEGDRDALKDADAAGQPAPAVPAQTAEPEPMTRRAEARADTPPSAASAVPVASPPPSVPTPPPSAPAPPPVPTAAPPVPTAPPPVDQARERVGATAAAADTAGAAAGARQDAREESLGAGMQEAPAVRAMMAPIQIATPDPRVRWRVSGSLAQRSTDGGVSWIDQPLEPGITILAGAAVTTRIAWLAGRSGSVFRTVDGTSWMRVSRPASDDLVTVEASSQDRATVTAQNGRRFVTTDGGRTWAAF